MFFTFTRSRAGQLCVANRVPNAVETAIHRFHQHTNMNTKPQGTYEGAICALNSLQSNAAYIQKASAERKLDPEINVKNTAKHLKCLGIEVRALDALNIIHVSGTKGKGSTCAFTESILRHYGAKTGFYSSPHLVHVSERIRINGQPLSRAMFSSYFWHVFDTLLKNLEDNEKMPAYFMFLTVMGLYVFMKEKVDVAIIEVGIGGLYDCTNIIEKPVAVGVATLGLDHTQLLGTTLVEIAEQKAGIFKPSVPAFTVPQPEGALRVLRKQAQLVECSLHIVPPFEAYEQESEPFSFGLLGEVQNLNASLALQLAHAWLSRETSQGFTSYSLYSEHELSTPALPVAPFFTLSHVFIKGLRECSWPGRFHTVKKENFTFYLDGAHTPQSMKHCVRWFAEATEQDKTQINGKVRRILLFNCTGMRKVDTLLDPLSNIHFDLVLFSPNQAFEIKDVASDQSNFTVDYEVEINRCQVNRDIWCHLMRSYHENAVANSSFSLNLSRHADPESTRVFTCLGNTMKWILKSDANCDNLQHLLGQSNHYQVLVTGSLHLVGGVLSIIDPDMLSIGHSS